MLALATELGYAGPDPAGRALRSGRAGAIGVMFTEGLSYAFEDPAAIATLGGVASEAERAATSLVLLPASFSSAGGPSADAVRAAIVDAFFVISLPEDHPGVLAALERNVPVVIADTPLIPGVPFVGIDDRGGARSAAAHLTELGHTHVGVVAFRLRADDHEGMVDAERRHRSGYRVTRERLEGYTDALDGEWDAVPIYETFPNSRAAARGRPARCSRSSRARRRCWRCPTSSPSGRWAPAELASTCRRSSRSSGTTTSRPRPRRG